MRREVLVTTLLPDGRAEVVMDRPSACGGSCASCGGCPSRQARAVADNPIHAQPGEWVQIEGSDRRLLAMTAVVYLLPLALLIGGWLLAEALWQLPGPGALGGFALGVAAVIAYGRRAARHPPVYSIVARR